MLVDLASFSVLPQQPAQNPLSPHPLDLCRHTSLGGTLPFSSSGMPALALGSEEIASAGARVDGCGFDDDRTVLDELLNVRAGVCVPDFRLFIGVKPNFALADTFNGCGERF